MEYQTIRFEMKEGIGWITLNRPKAMNALSTELLTELNQVVDEIESNAEIRVAIIKGEGGKAFSAGADLQEIAALGIRGSFDYSRNAHRVFDRIEQSGTPFIACINGMAMGGGAELALSCHLKVATEKATVSFPEAGLGGIPGMGGTQRLPRLIGKSPALYYLLTGENIPAEKASQLGLFHKVVTAEDVEKEAGSLARKLQKKSPFSLKLVIQAVVNGMEGHLDEGLVLESALMAVLGGSEDKKEGIKAIFEKRSPDFKGE